MVVVMRELATDEQIQGVIAQLTGMGFDVHRSTGALRTVLGAVGGQRQFDTALLEVLDGVQEVVRITEPYKLASRTFKRGEHRHRHRRPPHRRRRSDRHGRAVLGRDRGAGRGDRAGGRAPPAPRCCAAARSSRAARPTASRAWAKTACGCCAAAADRHNLKLVHRGHGHQPARADREVRAHPAGRRAQHAELHAAARARPHPHAGAAQARHLGDDRGVAAVGRVHPGRRQHERDAVRARHPHLRELHPQHARHLGHPGRPEAEPPADHRRSEPRHRASATR